jgi:Ca-activated chloride channel family protein
VHTASYANVRRFLSHGELPPAGAVRVEELVNYFPFDYPAPGGGRPISLTTEIADCPWAPSHKLVLIGARAASPHRGTIAGRNIVLLIDVSGSMAPPERLPLLKAALAMFVDTLDPEDRLAIVTYASTSGVVLPSTPASARGVIQRAIGALGAGGSTNGGGGLIAAYRVAREAFIPGGVNRVILATDGDFNVGIVNHTDLLRLIERERESGVFLSVLGVGTDNLKDATMEMLADKGNGNYAYLDSVQEGRRVLIHEGSATLETAAQDVKFQVEFNPARVGAWKLIGYENRALDAEDFNDDRKDAGEMGSGDAVTVLYELVPAGASIDAAAPDGRPVVDALKYQRAPVTAGAATTRGSFAGEWLTVKVRYKKPNSEVSDVLAQPLVGGGRVVYLPFASAVAEYGLLLGGHVRNAERWDALASRLDGMRVPASLAADKAAFAGLVDVARGLAGIGVDRPVR